MKYNLSNVRYISTPLGKLSYLRIYGACPEHPIAKDDQEYIISVSSPRSYDPETLIFTTKSGTIYKITSFSMDQTEFERQILRDIQEGQYERQ